MITPKKLRKRKRSITIPTMLSTKRNKDNSRVLSSKEMVRGRNRSTKRRNLLAHRTPNLKLKNRRRILSETRKLLDRNR